MPADAPTPAVPLPVLARRAAGFLPTKLRDQIKKIEATDIKIDGDKATANAKPSVNNAKILFVKEDGDWKLDTDTKVS